MFNHWYFPSSLIMILTQSLQVLSLLQRKNKEDKEKSKKTNTFENFVNVENGTYIKTKVFDNRNQKKTFGLY